MRPFLFLTAILTLAGLLSVAPRAATAGVTDCRLNPVGELPVHLENGLPIADGVLNGKPVRALIDTGSTRHLVSVEAARRLGLSFLERRVPGLQLGQGDWVKAGTLQADTLQMGPWQGTDARVQVVEAGDFGAGADMVLGQDLFVQSDVELDMAHNVIRFFRPSGCDDVPLAYWAKTYSQATLRSRGFGGFSVSRVVVRLNDQEFWARLDTGVRTSAVNTRMAHRVDVREDSPGSQPGPERHDIGRLPVPTWIGTFGTLAVGDEVIRNARLSVGDYYNLGVARDGTLNMVLGMDFIRSHRIYIANSQDKIYFTNVSKPVFGAGS
ncbi:MULTISPECIES: retropepsin-like aspartic protease [Nitrospirillum]|uniref:Aspartyl protease n=1 Tax=Nitrospirillum amazonense TaxID=28077 RepID=A0A560G1L3_9PROT|nr:retropepsin-like aspartic protease [Nitrospirillum amazonense]MEC4589587.1 retropepsin-like aspartic protease [Nitrospirillum amazonense]TWB27600.1 aspartyl protease [Nitrospirillum amazonense]